MATDAEPGTGELELAWVEHLLPGRSAGERAAFAAELCVGLEVALRPGLDARAVAASGVPVVTVQAWELHEHHPLSPDARERGRAADCVRRALDLAAELGAPRVLAVCGFGPLACEAPLERARDFFASLADAARAAGARILVEPLSPARAAVCSHPDDAAHLLGLLGHPELFAAALDAGHLADAGLDPAGEVARFAGPLGEVQLRGAGSSVPRGDEAVVRAAALRLRGGGALAVEHREPVDAATARRVAERLRATLAGGARG